MIKSAADLKKGECGIIVDILIVDSQQRKRLLDLGYLPDTEICCYAKTYGSIAFVVKKSTFAIRNEDATKIILK